MKNQLFENEERSVDKRENYTLDKQLFYCKEKHFFISLHYVCNGLNDCGDNEDERTCNKSTFMKTQSISNDYTPFFKLICDHIVDFPDGSDEIHCGK